MALPIYTPGCETKRPNERDIHLIGIKYCFCHAQLVAVTICVIWLANFQLRLSCLVLFN